MYKQLKTNAHALMANIGMGWGSLSETPSHNLKTTRLAQYALRLLLLLGVLVGSSGNVLADEVTFSTTQLVGLSTKSGGTTSLTSDPFTITVAASSNSVTANSSSNPTSLKFQSGTTFTLKGDVYITKVVVNCNSSESNKTFTATSTGFADPVYASSNATQTFSSTDATGVDASSGLTFTASASSAYVTSIVVTYTTGSTTPSFAYGNAVTKYTTDAGPYTNTLNNIPTGVTASYSYTCTDGTPVSAINSLTGEVTLSGTVGTATIKATFALTDASDTETTVPDAVSYTLTVSLASPNLSYETTSLTKYTTDAAFTNELTNPNNLTGITYSSSDEDKTVVSVNSSTGEVTINGEGTATIYAKYTEDATYEGQTVSYELEVTKPSAGLAYATTEVSLTLDGTNYSINGTYKNTLTNPNSVSVTYDCTSNDESVAVSDVASVDENGTVTINGEGSVTITASFTGNDTYSSGEASYTLTISKQTPSLTFATSDAVSITLGSTYAIDGEYDFDDINELTNTGNGAVTYTSSDVTVASVTEDGKLKIVGTGTTTITATSAATDTYKAGSATYALTIAYPSNSVSFGTSGVSTFFTGIDTKDNGGEQSLTADDITITFYSSSDGSRINCESGKDSLYVRTGTSFTITSPYEGVKITKVVVTQDSKKTARTFYVYENGSASSSEISPSSYKNTYISTSGVSSVTFSPKSSSAYVEKIEVTYTSSTVLAGITYSNVDATSTTNAAYKMAFNSNTGTIRGGRMSAHFIGLGVAYGADGETWYSEASGSDHVATTAATFAATDGVPTAGYFLTLEAYTNGYVTLDCKGATSYTVYHDSNNKTETVENTSSSFVVHGGHTYYVYNSSSNLNVSSVTFEPSFIYETEADGTETYSRLITTSTPTLNSTPEIGKEFDFPEIGSQEDAGYITKSDGSSSYILVATNGDVSLVSGTSDNITVTCTIPTTDKIISTSNLSYIIPGITGNTKVYMVSGTPKVGQKAYVYASDSDTTPLITMTYGGWIYNDSTYVDIYDNDKELTDTWTEADQTDIAGKDDAGFRTRTIDGFYLDSNCKNDAKSEVYVNTTDTTHGHFVVGDKNSIPCRGSYFLFEPAQNGKLSVYILQNGCINEYTTDTSTKVYWPVKKDSLTGVVSWRPLYFVDETGTPVVADTAYTKKPRTWTSTTLKTATDKISSDKNSEDTDYGLYWDYTYDTNNQNLNDMPAAKQAIIKAAITEASKYDEVTPFESGDGGYFLLEKSYAKYTFDVTVGKSYYLFSNFTKIGISGFLFEPGDTQPVSGSNYNLANKVTETYSAPKDTCIARATFTGRSNFKTNEDGEYEWTTLCLPFSVSAAQMRKAFGDDVTLIEFKNVNTAGDTINFIHHIYDQTVAAGVPYLIKPSSLQKTDKDSVYIDGGIYFPATAVTPDTVKSVNNGGMDGFEWRGQFTNDSTLTAGDHYIANGKVYYYTDDTKKHNSNSFRAFLKQTGTDGNGAKVFLTATSMGDSADGTTTGIMSIETLEAAQDAATMLNTATGVYNLSGQKVGNDSSVISSLPAGIYIVNGKKLVIR